MSTIDTTTAYAFQTHAGGWRVTGSRVSLDSVVWGYHSGLTPEEIVAQFPSLSPEQVYGAIAFYLRNRAEIDLYLKQQEKEWEKLQAESAARMGPLLERLRARRLEGLNSAGSSRVLFAIWPTMIFELILCSQYGG